LTLLSGPLLLACAYAAGPTAGDLKRLQGAWVLESLELNGKAVAIDSLKIDRKPLAPRLTVKGERYTLALADKPFAMACWLDPGHTPKWINLTVLEGPDKGKVFQGIYKLEGDRFTICRPLDSTQRRPTAFATTQASGLINGVWNRVRP
jgi:uncharacterized protein (TIGR03067 family)